MSSSLTTSESKNIRENTPISSTKTQIKQKLSQVSLSQLFTISIVKEKVKAMEIKAHNGIWGNKTSLKINTVMGKAMWSIHINNQIRDLLSSGFTLNKVKRVISMIRRPCKLEGAPLLILDIPDKTILASRKDRCTKINRWATQEGQVREVVSLSNTRSLEVKKTVVV